VILVLLLGGGLGWVVRSAQVQREAVAKIQGDGGFVYYDWEWKDGLPLARVYHPSYLDWLSYHLGIDDDFLSNVVCVELRGSPSDEKLALVADLHRLQEFNFIRPRSSLRHRRSPLLAIFQQARIAGQIGLKETDPGDTNLTDAGLAHLRNLTGLRKLDLKGTLITDGGMTYLEGLTDLRELDLSSTAVNDAGLVHLRGLTVLQHLDLSSTEVTDAGLQHLAALKGLQRLDLSGTRVTDAGLERLVGLRNPQVLYLDDTEVIGPGLVHLKKLINLKELGLGSWKSVGDIMGQEARRAMPGVKVIYNSIRAQ
jgi:hypothetical protein